MKEVVVLLRGVMPTGKNKIPKMSELVTILEEAGFKDVRTYIQSGNVILKTDMSDEEIKNKIHKVILEKIGADLKIIIKTKNELEIAIKENKFKEDYDFSRIHLAFTNDEVNSEKLKEVQDIVFEGEILNLGSNCFYMYLPRDSKKKKLNNNFLEKKLGITLTTRKLNVIQKLYGMMS